VKIWSLFGRPSFLMRFHGAATVFWMVLWIVATIADWISSVRYVSHLSQAALVLGSWSAWQAARTEVVQQKMIEESE
jgi:hypothetical protein